MEVRILMESALKGYLSSLKGKKVAVIGLGVSNGPLVERALDAGVPVLVSRRWSAGERKWRWDPAIWTGWTGPT